MKTVQDYLDLGLVFVDGDKGYKHIIESFAWRNNDGVKPEYKGVIEVELKDGTVMRPKKSSELMWPPKLRGFSEARSIIKWRPVVLQSNNAQGNNDESFPLPIGIDSPELREAFKSLEEYLENKPPFWNKSIKTLNCPCVKVNIEAINPTASPKEDKPMKPVYTAEMHAKGEMPPVGAECIYVFNDDEQYIGEVAAMDGDACWFKRSEFGYKTFIGKHKFKPIIKTIKVNGFDVPAPMSEAPEHRQMVYLAHAAHVDFNLDFTWQGDDASVSWLSRGLVHSTKSAAIAHAKAMLGVNPNPARSGDGYDRNVLGQNNEGDEI